MLKIVWLLTAGLVGGTASGALGIGGAILIIPMLVYLFGFDQKTAQGTTLLLMLPPIGILAAWEYYRRGQADPQVAAWICLGFVAGGFLGAKMTTMVSSGMLGRLFGLLLVIIGLKMFLKP